MGETGESRGGEVGKALATASTAEPVSETAEERTASLSAGEPATDNGKALPASPTAVGESEVAILAVVSAVSAGRTAGQSGGGDDKGDDAYEIGETGRTPSSSLVTECANMSDRGESISYAREPGK